MGPGFKTELELLEREQHNLPHEIHHSRTTAMREDLQRRMDLTQSLLAKLERRAR
jgi:hypothetical protein